METTASSNGKTLTIVGWILSILPTAGLIMSSVMKFRMPPEFVENLPKIGWKQEMMSGLGIVELACVAIYLIPQTAVLGAILITGYLGGAIATHVRIGDFSIAPQIIIAVLAWLGIFLREPRLRAILPIR